MLACIVLFSVLLVFLSPTSLLSHWLLGRFIDEQAFLELSPPISVLTQFGFDIFLPAGILALSACLLGFRISGEPRIWQQCYLASLPVGYFVFWIAMRENQLYGWFVFAGAAFIAIWLIGGALLAASELIQHGTKLEPPSLNIRNFLRIGLLPLTAPLIVLVVLLTQDVAAFSDTGLRKASFLEKCQTVGVKFLSKPSGPITSIAYDYSKGSGNGYSRVELDKDGRPTKYGEFGSGIGPSEALKKLDVDFYQIRATKPNGDPLEGGRLAYFLTRGSSIPVEVGGVTPDAVVRYSVDKPEELSNPSIYRHAVKYSIELAETRSGKTLGIYSYVIDRINGRACGANIRNVISEQAFFSTC